MPGHASTSHEVDGSTAPSACSSRRSAVDIAMSAAAARRPRLHPLHRQASKHPQELGQGMQEPLMHKRHEHADF